MTSVHVICHLQQLGVLPVSVGGEARHQRHAACEGRHGGVVRVLQPAGLAGPRGGDLTAARPAAHHLGPRQLEEMQYDTSGQRTSIYFCFFYSFQMLFLIIYI